MDRNEDSDKSNALVSGGQNKVANILNRAAKVIPFERKPRLSEVVKNILAAQPIFAADLEQFLSKLPENDRIKATELIVRQQYL